MATQEKSYIFDLKTKKNELIECVMVNRNGKAKFIFEKALITSGKTQSQNMMFEVESINNPVGYIVDKMQRLAEKNEDLIAMIIDGETIELHPDYIDSINTTKAVYLGDDVVPEGGRVVMYIFDKTGLAVSEKSYSYDDCLSDEVVLTSPVSITVPVKIDKNNNPRYTRNEYLNKVLFAAKIPVGDDAKKFAKLIQEARRRLPDVVAYAKRKGLRYIDSAVMEKICSMRKMDWEVKGVKQLPYSFRTHSGKGKYQFPVDSLKD